jgi:ketose-bisphosphate aldolase
MALISLMDTVREARCEGRGIPLFVNFDMLTTEGIIRACEETGRPAFLGTWSGFLDRPGGPEYARWVRAVAENSEASLSLMLDHGQSVDHCLRAIDIGFTDVMIDASKLPLAENLAATKQVAAAARAAGVGIEAELGHVGSGRDYAAFLEEGGGLTDVDEAERFVTETGIDILAVAIGTAHGEYSGEPRLDHERLRSIAARVDLPLAVHGGSGLTDEQFLALIAEGITKVNIGTLLRIASQEAIVQAAAEPGARYGAFIEATREATCRAASHYIRLFAGEGDGAGQAVGSATTEAMPEVDEDG